MPVRYYFALVLLGVFSYGVVSRLQAYPGYMDADYYYAGGLQLINGYGFKEPFLWNYLNNPESLPQPSHTYWMPLASILSAAGLFLFCGKSFKASQLIFILIALCIPPITAWLTNSFERQPRKAILAGCLAIFPGFYLPFMTTTDTFGIYMILGALFFLLTSSPMNIVIKSFFIGIISGLMHLARSDGLLWFGLGMIAIFMDERWKTLQANKHSISKQRAISILVVVLGYALVMFPWYLRNLTEFGTMFAPGSTRVLWMTYYNELFSYPPDSLNVPAWLQSGIRSILMARIWALKQNLISFVAVQGGIFLLPLTLLGLWRFRKDLRVKLWILAWLMIHGMMTFVFPFIGARGGLFHAASSLQTLSWAMVPYGLEMVVSWGEKHRSWNKREAYQILAIGIVLIAILMTAVLVYKRVVGIGTPEVLWGRSEHRYKQIEKRLVGRDGAAIGLVMVNNPPGYFIVSGRPAIVIPDGGIECTLSVAKKYGARYVVLEEDRPPGLDQLYLHPQSVPGLKYLSTIEEAHLFEYVGKP